MTAHTVVPFSAVAKSPDERRIDMLYRRVLAEQHDTGFSCGEHRPNIRYISSKQDCSFTGHQVRYDSERKTILFDLKMIRGITKPLTQQDLMDTPELTQAFVVGGGSGELFKPTTDVELVQLIARAVAEHFVHECIEYECNSSWLSTKDKKPHEDFAAGLIRGGIIEYISRISAPTSETVAESIWETYDEDPALKTKTNARNWFESCGGYALVAPILGSYKTKGLRYLLEHQLQIDRHFSLTQVPVYQAQALADLSVGIT